MDEKEIEKLKARVLANSVYRNIYVPFSERLGCEHDFEVHYQIDKGSLIESFVPYQGMRCDFLYADDDPLVDGFHRIYPEFSSANGSIILDTSVSIPIEGTATMWIMGDQKNRERHKNKLSVGTKAFWVVGSQHLANIVVTKLNLT